VVCRSHDDLFRLGLRSTSARSIATIKVAATQPASNHAATAD
jgi:hypothetical protein